MPVFLEAFARRQGGEGGKQEGLCTRGHFGFVSLWGRGVDESCFDNYAFVVVVARAHGRTTICDEERCVQSDGFNLQYCKPKLKRTWCFLELLYLCVLFEPVGARARGPAWFGAAPLTFYECKAISAQGIFAPCLLVLSLHSEFSRHLPKHLASLIVDNFCCVTRCW